MRLLEHACYAAAVVLSAAAPAVAQARVQLQTDASADKVELGQGFRVQLTAMSDGSDQSLASPRLRVPAGVTAQGPTISTRQYKAVVNGRLIERKGFTAAWMVIPRRLGKLTIGPPTVQVDGQTVSGQSVRVEVVPAGTLQQQRQRRSPDPPSHDPFDLFRRHGLRLPGLFDEPDDRGDILDHLPPVPQEYQLDRAPDPLAFLRVVPSKHNVVVGEQLTLSIYAYGSRGRFRETSAKEPAAPEFLSYTIVENSFDQSMQLLPIDDELWHAVKVRELALFPLRAGNLKAGGMEMGFVGRGYSRGVQNSLTRQSDTVTINVIEPPLAGRPAGYRIGDVGRYELGAEVTPRQANVGDTISVRVNLEGIGNLPAKLLLPESKQVEWLEPTVKSDIGPQAGGLIGGSRRFQYLVRLKQAGNVDLGGIELPYYNPHTEHYATARASLGYVKVEQGDAPEQTRTEETPASKLDGLLQARTRLGEPPEPKRYLTDRVAYWLLLGGAPLGIGLLHLGALGLGRLTRRLRERRGSSETKAQRALREAEQAAKAGELPETVAAVERALFAAIESALGLRARALLLDELEARLTAGQVDSDLARDVRALLEDCQTARFQGPSSGGAPEDYVTRVKPLLKALGRVKVHVRATSGEAS